MSEHGHHHNSNHKVPETIKSRIFLQRNTLYIDKNLRSNALLKSWIATRRKEGTTFDVVDKDLDDIVMMREESVEASSEVKNKTLDDLKIRAETLQIIEDGSKYRCSDIHMLVRPEFTEIQFRINGDLKVYKQYPPDMGEQFARTIIQGLAKVRDASYLPGEFQNAQISGETIKPLGLTSIRVARGPCYPQEDGGSFAVLRMQYDGRKKDESQFMPYLEAPKKPEGRFMLAEQGYTPLQMDLLERLASMPEGIICISGPTGSGKTTTLHQILMHIARESPCNRLVTIEDPVEYPMPWAIQLAVTNANDGEETGSAYAKCSRISLRMDPDYLLVGEIRDKEVAQVAIEAAMTGHQVWATTHVNCAFNTINRLENMDNTALNRKITCDHTLILGLIAQRLVSKLCPECAEPLSNHLDKLPKGLYEAMLTWSKDDFSKAKMRVITRGTEHACKKCRGEGISGRQAIAEVVATDAKLMEDYITSSTEMARKNHRMKSGSDKSLMGNAIEYIRQGICDPLEVSKKIGVIVPYQEGL